MKPIEGFTVLEQTEDKIVMENRWGKRGVIRVSGNPNPPPKEHQRTVNKIAEVLRPCEQRRLEREGTGT